MRAVATAGHVDHGKSTLVAALTGTDPDRFPEEKARGLTIDLGFAFCELPSGVEVGFVDVPGHTRFVKNMLAGVGAVEVAVLVVAANEGWKPQSEEHLRILELLDVGHGIVVLSKADLVDDETLAIARLDVEDHLTGTAFAALEIVACDARSGRGLEDVRAALDRALAAAPAPRDADRPRLWIDRVFSAKGAGTVVTGTLTGGVIAVDDELLAGGIPVRVRGIQRHGTEARQGEPGARVALNLAGVSHDRLTRGDAVVRAGQWLDVGVVDVALTVLPELSLARRRRLAAAVGSGEQPVWCRRLDERFARLRFDRPVPLAPGDRIVLRDPGAGRTVAGAEVLDVSPTRRAVDAPERLARPLGARLLADGWVRADALGAYSGLATDAAEAAVAAVGAEVIGDWRVDPAVAGAVRNDVHERVRAHHRAQPTDPGIAVGALGSATGLDAERIEALLSGDAEVVLEHGRVRDRGHHDRASDSDAGRTLLATLDANPFAPPPATDRGLVRALVREGAVVDLDGITFSTGAIESARTLVVEAMRTRGSLTIADARDLLGSTRKYVVPIMSHLDATGVTRRRGDDRIPGPRSGLADPDPVG